MRIYLDNNATTALDPRVLQSMLLELQGPPSNPSSIHYFGQQAKALLVKARKSIAEYFKAKSEELIFTSGGTESINLLLRGFFGARPKGHLITTAIEHSSAYHTIRSLEGAGLETTFVKVGLAGAPTPEAIREAIRPTTAAIFLTAANSETGVKLDLLGILAVAKEAKVPLLLDCVGFIGKEELPFIGEIDAIAVSAHKFHGPKGIGALITRPNVKLSPLFTGGAQEYNRRAGTENLAAILGFAEAIRILKESQVEITSTLLDLRDCLEKGLMSQLGDVVVNGEGPRIANTSNLSFGGVDGETLLMHLDMAGIAASHGSACASGALEPSRVLLEMGVSKVKARNSIRFSVSRFNTKDEIDQCIARTVELIKGYTRIVGYR